MKDSNLESPTFKSPADLRIHARSLLQGYVAEHGASQLPKADNEEVAGTVQPDDVMDAGTENDLTLHGRAVSETIRTTKSQVISRRALFGLPDTADGSESKSVSSKKRTVKRRPIHMAVAGMVGVVSTFAISQILSSDETTASVTPNITIIETTVSSLPTASTVETTVVPTTLTPTSTIFEAASTTTIATVAIETTIPPVIEVPATPVSTETSAPLPVSLYDSLDCSQVTMIVQAGMTFSEIAEHCGMTMSRLQSYNTSIDPTNHFIAGTKLNLQKPAGANATNDNPKDCAAIGGVQTVIQPGFMPINYLKNIGLSEDAVTTLVYDEGILKKFGLVTVIAGTKECLPTRSAIKTLYGL